MRLEWTRYSAPIIVRDDKTFPFLAPDYAYSKHLCILPEESRMDGQNRQNRKVREGTAMLHLCGINNPNP
jgi:hypothetical protein